MAEIETTADDTTAGDGKCTLREAITNVNMAGDATSGDCVAGTGGGDVITFVLARFATVGLTLGQLTIQADVAITGSPAGPVIISGAHQTRVLEIAAGTTHMSGVTIKFGMADHGGGILVDSGAAVDMDTCTLKQNVATASGGGGLYNSGSATLTNCTVGRNESTGDGGGLLNLGTLSLTNCSFGGNGTHSSGNGGGVNNSGTASLTNCTFRRNRSVAHGATAKSGAAGNGGGLFNSGTATLTGCTFTRNAAPLSAGGGIAFTSDLTLTNCAFEGNSARDGGGLGGGGMMTLANCTISGNRALDAGGGIAFEGGTLNCSISGNRAGGSYEFGTGGGVYNFGNPLKLTNCTVSGNRSPTAGGDLFTSGVGGTVYLRNTIVAGTAKTSNCAGDNSFIATGPNLDSDGSCFGRAGIDPILAPLNDYGGPTRTMALCTGPGTPVRSCMGASPAIDNGDDTVIGPPDNLTTDQRGLPRLSGAHVDIGAYEVQ